MQYLQLLRAKAAATVSGRNHEISSGDDGLVQRQQTQLDPTRVENPAYDNGDAGGGGGVYISGAQVSKIRAAGTLRTYFCMQLLLLTIAGC